MQDALSKICGMYTCPLFEAKLSIQKYPEIFCQVHLSTNGANIKTGAGCLSMFWALHVCSQCSPRTGSWNSQHPARTFGWMQSAKQKNGLKSTSATFKWKWPRAKKFTTPFADLWRKCLLKVVSHYPLTVWVDVKKLRISVLHTFHGNWTLQLQGVRAQTYQFLSSAVKGKRWKECQFWHSGSKGVNFNGFKREKNTI